MIGLVPGERGRSPRAPRPNPIFIAALVVSCANAGGGAAHVEPASRPPAPATFPDDPRPLPVYHSARLGVSLRLPDGKAWRIDDHSRPELVATHAPTRSRVTVAVMRTEALVGRQQCEALAIERKLVPRGEMRTVEEAVEVRQETFDTIVRVAIAPGSGPGEPVVGHVMAFGGFLRKCFVFDYATEASGAAEEEALSARLAVARARILGGLRLDELGVVQREERPRGPAAP